MKMRNGEIAIETNVIPCLFSLILLYNMTYIHSPTCLILPYCKKAILHVSIVGGISIQRVIVVCCDVETDFGEDGRSRLMKSQSKKLKNYSISFRT